MRSAVALVISVCLLMPACFPNNAQHRTYAKLAEGGVLLSGIALLAVVNTGADCMTDVPGMPDTDCESRASLLSTVGLGLVLTGLIGFIVTVSTSPDDKTTTAAVTVPKPAAPATTPEPTAPAAPPAAPAAPTEPTPPTDPVPPTAPTPTN